jgi:SAM-dependent methyltransferase
LSGQATAIYGAALSDQAAFWDERYGGGDYAFGTEPNAFLVSQAHYLKPGLRALVPGDGEGRNGVWLAQRGLTVDTVDVSPAGVAKARKLALERGVEVNAQIADLLTWNWPENAYDIVAALYVHFFDTGRPLMHRAMLKALKPGGILILEAFSLQQLEMKKRYHSGGPKTPDMLYSKDKLAGDFADHSVMMLEEVATELNEGYRHKGHAAVVRAVVARRAEG